MGTETVWTARLVPLGTKQKQSKTKNPWQQNKDKLLLGQLLCIALGKIHASVDFAIFTPRFRRRHLGGNYGCFYLEEVSFSNCSTNTSFAQKVSRGPLLVLMCWGREFSNQLFRMVWRGMIRQTKTLLMS